MTTALANYVEMHEIVLFSGAKHYIDSVKYEAFKTAMQRDKFIEIDGELVNVAAIERVKRAKNDISIVETMLSGHSEDVKEKVRKVVREREKDSLAITEWVICNIIEKYA